MIRFVYFDIGGVALLDFSGTDKWIELKRGLGISPEQDKIFDRLWSKTRQRICIDCDVDTLIPTFKRELGMKFPKNYSMLKDFVDRFEPNPSIWPVIQQIKKTSRVGLLTNMYPRMLEEIQGKKLLPDIQWDVIINSSVVGYQKPDVKVFEIAQKAAKTQVSEMLFVENQEDSVRVAQKLGWKTFLYDPKNAEKSSKELLSYFKTLNS